MICLFGGFFFFLFSSSYRPDVVQYLGCSYERMISFCREYECAGMVIIEVGNTGENDGWGRESFGTPQRAYWTYRNASQFSGLS